MTTRGGRWLASALGVCLIGANVAIKPGPEPAALRRTADSVRRGREWRGRVVPPADVARLDGGAIRIGAPGDELTALVFVTTWCDECANELEEIRRYASRLRDEGNTLRVVAIDVQEDADRARRFVKPSEPSEPSKLIDIMIGLDTSGDVMRAYEVRTFPTTVLIGRDRRARLFNEGPLANADVVLDPIIRAEPGVTARPSR